MADRANTDREVIRAMRALEGGRFQRTAMYEAFFVRTDITGSDFKRKLTAKLATDRLIRSLKSTGQIVYDGHIIGWRFVR